MTSERRPYGSGSLFVRGRQWYGQWRVGGRLVKRRVGPVRPTGSSDGLTKSQAEARLRALIAGTTVTAEGGDRLDIESLGYAYIQHVEMVLERKPTTVQDYRIIVRRHFVPFFNRRKLDRITAGDVENFLGWQQRRGLASKTIANHLSLLNSLFSFAVRRGLVRANPVAGVDRPGAARAPDIRYLTLVELEALAACSKQDAVFGELDAAFIRTAGMTGLRLGELLALRWREVDNASRVVRVRQSYTRGRFGTPKSRRSVRAVPLGARVLAELVAWRSRTAYTRDDDLVFGHPELGTVLDPSRLRRRVKIAADAAGIRSIRLHDLRHTYGTLMAAAGTPLRTLQEWMGHEDYKTTSIYADYAPSPERAEEWAAKAFGS